MKKIFLLMSILALTACSNTQYCNDCVTYEPVEVIYRKTTYRTVYIPKTYKEVTLERRPYNRCEKERLCRK